MKEVYFVFGPDNKYNVALNNKDAPLLMFTQAGWYVLVGTKYVVAENGLVGEEYGGLAASDKANLD